MESDDFTNREKPPTEKQIDLLHDLANDLGIQLAGVDNLNREQVSEMIDEMKEKKLTQKAEEKAKKKEQEHGV